MRKLLIYAISAAIFGAIGSLAYGSEYEKTHPPLNLSAFSTETPKAEVKACDCVHGEKCTCGDECTCAEGVGCGKRAARRAARQQDSGTEESGSFVGFDPQAIPVQTVVAETTKCPCCGMEMTTEQFNRARARLAAPVQASPQIAPVQAAPVWQTNYAMPTFGAGAGSCSGGNCAGGNCGTGRVGLFRRR